MTKRAIKTPTTDPGNAGPAPGATGPQPAAAPHPAAKVVVRHYAQGIGDCHLLRFPKPEGGDIWMLIDCGVHSSVSGGSATMNAVVADIALQTKHIDIVVVTHEHTDHVSAFLSAAAGFEQITFGDVWFAWTENPADPQARALDKYKQQALAALVETSARLDRAQGLSDHLTELKEGLDAVVGFNFGAKGDKVRAARDAARDKATGKVVYREPSDPPITIPGLPDLRIFVLGPPRDAQLLGLTERATEMYGVAAAPGWRLERALTSAFEAAVAGGNGDVDFASPFDANIGIDLKDLQAAVASNAQHERFGDVGSFAFDRYFGPSLQIGPAIRPRQRVKPVVDPFEHDQSWRRIDYDWLGISADLAMQLDDKTNNTSLVLAFEWLNTGRVLLFAADAQVGNWLSWQGTSWTLGDTKVTGPDLLARTVYYKVGHHGSHNATLKEKGLELMKSSDLSAFIPTNEADAKKVGWGAMPYKEILDALEVRCSGRVVRADDPWVAMGNPAGPTFSTPSGSILSIGSKCGLWVEMQLA